MKSEIVKIPLRKVVVAQKGVKPIALKNKIFKDAVPYLDIHALETGNFREYTFQELGNLSSEKDILVVWDGSRSGLVLKGKRGVVGSTLMKLTPIGLNIDYLFYFIKSNYDIINSNLTGGGIPHVNSDLFFDLKIPYISIPSQKLVINELERRIKENQSLLNHQKGTIRKLLSEAGAASSGKENIAEIISNFQGAILDQGISGKLTEKWRQKNKLSKKSELVSLGSVIIEIKSGKSFRCLERPPEMAEIGVIKISAVSTSGYREEESKTCIDKDKINPALFIRKGDFLLTRANTKELVGACTIVNKVRKKIMLSDKVLRITFDNTKVLDDFVLYFLKSKEGRVQIENYATGSQESMKNITQEEIKSMLLYLPSLKEQNEIVSLVTELLRIVDKIHSQYKKAVTTFEKLENSILKQVFSDKFLMPYQSGISMEEAEKDIRDKREVIEKENVQLNKIRSKERSIMKKTVTTASTLDIEDLLKQRKEPMSAKEVWQASIYHKDIDGFYEALKKKVEATITWKLVKINEEVPESIISLKSDA